MSGRIVGDRRPQSLSRAHTPPGGCLCPERPRIRCGRGRVLPTIRIGVSGDGAPSAETAISLPETEGGRAAGNRMPTSLEVPVPARGDPSAHALSALALRVHASLDL